MICQDMKKLKLPYSQGREDQSGYESLANMIIEFDEIGTIKCNLDIDRINDGSGVMQTLEKNHAGFHRDCKLKLYSLLRRERSCISAINKKRKTMDDNDESSSPVKTRQKLGIIPTNEMICFFL